MFIPKVIFIDWYKTLSDSLFWEQLASSDHKYHHYLRKIESYLFEENPNILSDWMRGVYTSEEICTQICKEKDLDSRVVIDELYESCRNMKFISDEIPILISKIREKGINIVVVTDNMDTFRGFTIESLDLSSLFDGFLISNEIGHLKKDFGPNGEVLFFDKYIKTYGFSYSETILIDDSIDKTGTMKKKGMNLIQVTKQVNLVKIFKSIWSYDYLFFRS